MIHRTRCGLLSVLVLLAGCGAPTVAGRQTRPIDGEHRSAIHRDPLGLLRAGKLTEASDVADSELRAVIAFVTRNVGDPKRMARLLQRRLDRTTMAALAGYVPAQGIGGETLHSLLALRRLHSRADPAAAGVVRALADSVQSPRLSQVLRESLSSERRSSTAKRAVIGVLLPLTGRFGRIGQAALRAIKLALHGRRIRLVVKDTRGEALRCAGLVESMVRTEGVLGILGPIGAFESTTAAQRATELGVPLVSLSAREGLPELGGSTFRTRVTAGRQGRRLARYAVRRLGIRRFGILLSDSAYGWALAGAFWDEISALGAEVVSAQAYPRDRPSWRKVVKRLVGGKAGHRAKPMFEGLLIADDYRAVRRLLPLLPYWGVRVKTAPGEARGLQLLGGAGWNHPRVVDQAEGLTDNAIFCDSFFPDGSIPRIRRFVERFYGRYREPPTPFEAEVYDAARILALALRRTPRPPTAAGLKKALEHLPPSEGLTGLMRFAPTGDAIKEIRLLTVDRDRIRPRVSEAEERVLRRRRP